jgi:hypothetical protein
VRALEELGRTAFPDGPPPRPDWWSEAVLQPQRRGPGRRTAPRSTAPVAD